MKFYSTKSNAVRALKAIGATLVDIADKLIVPVTEGSGFWLDNVTAFEEQIQRSMTVRTDVPAAVVTAVEVAAITAAPVVAEPDDLLQGTAPLTGDALAAALIAKMKGHKVTAAAKVAKEATTLDPHRATIKLIINTCTLLKADIMAGMWLKADFLNLSTFTNVEKKLLISTIRRWAWTHRITPWIKPRGEATEKAANPAKTPRKPKQLNLPFATA
jgi:hypothetical protein